MNKTVAKTRIPWLDSVRVVACFLVCLIHAPIPREEGSLWLSAYNYLTAPSIGLFFMLSGALIFPVRQPLSVYLPKKLKRIVLPLIFWSVACVAWEVVSGGTRVEEGLRKLALAPFHPVKGVYWFLYVLLGLYLFAPLVSGALEKVSHSKYWLALWGLSLVMPYLNAWIPEAWPIRGDYYHILSMFGGYMGYMVLGNYLRHHPISGKALLKKWLLPSALLIALIPAYFMNGRYQTISNDMLYGYLTINVALLCILYFTVLQLPLPCISTVHKISSYLAPQTFGIYLIHIFVMRDALWPLWNTLYPSAPHSIQIPTVGLLTFAASWVAVKIISYTPISRYII